MPGDAELASLLLRRGPAVSIPSTPPTTLLSVVGRGSTPRSEDVSTSSAADSLYSSHDCVGDLSDVKPRAQRACVFRRLCVDPASGEFRYYRRPNVTLPPVLFDRRYGHIFDFAHRGQNTEKDGSADFLPLNKHVRYKPHVRWSPRLVDGALPADHELRRGVHLLSAPFVRSNLGHVAWEEAFPLLLVMAQLGVWTPRATVLRTHACNESIRGGADAPDLPTASEARLCRKFADGFLRPLEGRHAPDDNDGGAGELLTVAAVRAAAAAARRPLCFESVVAGGYFDMFNVAAHPGQEGLLQLYRHAVLRHHRVLPRAPPTEHQLLVVKKEGRRGIANVGEVLSFLRKGCGGQCEGVPRPSAVAFHTLSLREQLRLVSRTTLALSPAGGVSMILPFLPEGAHVILVNYAVGPQDEKRRGGHESSCTRCSWTMEAELWQHVRWVRKLFYQVWEPDDFAGGKPGRESAVVIKLPRLAFLVRAALNAMAAPAAEAR